MKTLYCNGTSDVQVSNENKKTSKRIGTASMGSVFSAKKEGDTMTFLLSTGKRVGVSIAEFAKFMSIHDNEVSRLNVDMKNMPLM